MLQTVDGVSNDDEQDINLCYIFCVFPYFSSYFSQHNFLNYFPLFFYIDLLSYLNVYMK